MNFLTAETQINTEFVFLVFLTTKAQFVFLQHATNGQ
ncbi:hypothetical protein QFZ20_005187 [Flavobacterium sp. W4I14]|nr:hypothetical protein [Flavobacterium sp. W4I14]